jgi:hypothetical protein
MGDRKCQRRVKIEMQAKKNEEKRWSGLCKCVWQIWCCAQREVVEVSLYRFLTSALDGGKCLACCPGHLNTSETSPATPGTGGWVGKEGRNIKDRENKKKLSNEEGNREKVVEFRELKKSEM